MNIINQIFAHFAPTPQKTAEQIQAIPEDDKIYVQDWNDKTGYFVLDLHHIWWPEETICYRKEFGLDDFEEFCRERIGVIGAFGDWWRAWSELKRLQIIGLFVDAHKPMLQNELDEYYKKACIV